MAGAFTTARFAHRISETWTSVETGGRSSAFLVCLGKKLRPSKATLHRLNMIRSLCLVAISVVSFNCAPCCPMQPIFNSIIVGAGA